MKKVLYFGGCIHPMTSEDTEISVMGTEGDKICYLGNKMPADADTYYNRVNLKGLHVYPALTDAHVHLLYSLVLAASSFFICNITPEGVKPDNFADLETRVREYSRENPKQKIIVANGYVIAAVKEQRLPTRQELDDWTENRPMIIYSIDGHSSAMSTAFMEKLKLPTEGSNGIFTGEAHEFIQGKVTSYIASAVTPKILAKGIANFSNQCASYGISRVCAMDGNEDVKNDILTKVLAVIAARMELNIRLFPQYMDFDRLKPFRSRQVHPRAGGCGVWELDGAVGSRSAAFYQPYLGTEDSGHCYYSTEKIAGKVKEALEQGITLTCHAIGEAAIDQIVGIYESFAEKLPKTGPMMRIDHFEFPSRRAVEAVKKLPVALTVQPGFSWVDKRFLHSYTRFLPESIVESQIPVKELMDARVCICGSTDSPVQSMNPYDQMLGMIQFYQEEQSLTPYEAMQTYTGNSARMLGEIETSGTLETGKQADFFATKTDIFCSCGVEISATRAEFTVIGGKRYIPKKGTVAELLRMFLKCPKKI